MPYLGTLDYADGSAAGNGAPARQQNSARQNSARQNSARQQNSAQRLRAVWSTLTVPDAVRDGIADAPGPVLLVDDQIDTGWTLTVAAMLLARPGATGVLPLALAATSG